MAVVDGIQEKGWKGRLVPCKSVGMCWFLAFSNLLVYQITSIYYLQLNVPNNGILENGSIPAQRSHSSSPLDIPEGKAVALPSVRVAQDSVKRGAYGGEGDKAHLGGFTEMDMDGMSPTLWKYMIDYFGIKSILDVGCGKGISTSWFHFHGVQAQCVEGSHDGFEKNILPNKATQVVEHDFSRGPWWPEETVDAVWCVEFLEHVGRNFHHNYLPAFRKAALLFVTHSMWGGWHHVEVHDSTWWISKFESYGFRYSAELTKQAKNKATLGQSNIAPNGKKYNAQHLWLHLLVFINPAVSALPEHAHLFAESGCFVSRGQPNKQCGDLKDAGKESKLPDSFLPIRLTPEMDTAWENHVFGKTSR